MNKLERMEDFIKEYGEMLVPVAVAVVGGIVGVIKYLVKKDKSRECYANKRN